MDELIELIKNYINIDKSYEIIKITDYKEKISIKLNNAKINYIIIYLINEHFSVAIYND